MLSGKLVAAQLHKVALAQMWEIELKLSFSTSSLVVFQLYVCMPPYEHPSARLSVQPQKKVDMQSCLKQQNEPPKKDRRALSREFIYCLDLTARTYVRTME